MSNTIGWGKGASNNSIGWGNVGTNGFGSIYNRSNSGETDLAGATDPNFIMEVDTSLGDGLASMALPIQGTQPMTVDWGDGTVETVTQTDTPSSANWVTHSYASGGVYEIKVSATLEYVYFNREGDKDKLTSVLNWGDCVWNFLAKAFSGCSNLENLPNKPIPNVENVTNILAIFTFCRKLTTIPRGLFDNFVNVTAADAVFQVTNISELPKGVFNKMTLVNRYTDAFNFSILTVQTLSRLYVELSLFNTKDNVNFHGGKGQYDPNLNFTIEGVTYNTGTERANLVSRGWSLTDGGETVVETKDIIVELGQSNMIGQDGDIVNPSYPFTSSNGFWFDGSTQLDITTLRGKAVGGSHANYFAERYFTLTNRNAVMIEAAANTSGLTTTSSLSAGNDWSSTGDLRDIAISKANFALSFYGKQRPKAALWCQGERDARELQSNPSYAKAEIKQGMQDVINWWKNNYPLSPFFISELGDEDPPEGTGEFQTVRDVQNEIVAENDNVFMAFTGAKDFPSKGFMSDDIHYSFEGYKLMGEAFAESVNTNA